MRQDITFREITRRLLDRWVQTSADAPASPRSVYAEILDMMTIKMRLSILWRQGEALSDWRLETIRKTGRFSSMVREEHLIQDGQLVAYHDQGHIANFVLPRLRAVEESQQPIIESGLAPLMGLVILYDCMFLPQKNKHRPEWVLKLTSTRSLLQPAPHVESLSVEESVIGQLLREGLTAKEIAREISLSPRMVEHRLSQLKERYKARNVVHLTAMLVAEHMDLAMPTADAGDNSAPPALSLSGSDGT